MVYGAPTCSASEYTKDHLEWACSAASGADAPEEIADEIHSALAGDPPLDPFDTGATTLSSNWELLDGSPYYGYCDYQATLMIRVLNLLGLNGALRLVRASTDAGAGNCEDHEPRTCPVHGAEYLQLDFYGGGQPANINNFEGCCETASHYYAVWPSHKATNDYTMLQTLGNAGVTQHYCWVNPSIGWWQPCDQSGSTPDIP